MISESVNLSTGPVSVSIDVKKALSAAPESHRSLAFRTSFGATTDFLSDRFNVCQTFIMTGSGTLANEAMLWQIRSGGSKGLILSNGEFGSRLINQATKMELNFETYKVSWGEAFDLADIECILHSRNIKWLLFCHCETSAGVINDLMQLTSIAKRQGCLCYADCMSTVGTRPMDLSGVAMATASSGKGLASIPGLALVFSNIYPDAGRNCPPYVDLSYYRDSDGIPYTISSNLVNALHIAVKQKLQAWQYDLASEYGEKYFRLLDGRGLLPFSSPDSKVFTIVTRNGNTSRLVRDLNCRSLIVSHESSYLKKRGLCQLALFGYYKPESLDHGYRVLKAVVEYSNFALPTSPFPIAM